MADETPDKTIYIVNRIYWLLRLFILCFFGVLGLHEIQISIGHIGGKDTEISFIFKYLIEAGPGLVISLLLILCIILFGLYLKERRLRYRKTEYFQDRITELELQIDPNRTTSGLTPQGKTRPDDV